MITFTWIYIKINSTEINIIIIIRHIIYYIMIYISSLETNRYDDEKINNLRNVFKINCSRAQS